MIISDKFRKKVKRATKELLSTLGHDPTNQEISKKLGCHVKEIEALFIELKHRSEKHQASLEASRIKKESVAAETAINLREQGKIIYYRDKVVRHLLGVLEQKSMKKPALTNAGIAYLMDECNLSRPYAWKVMKRAAARAFGCHAAISNGQEQSVVKRLNKRKNLGKEIFAQSMRLAPTEGEKLLLNELNKKFPQHKFEFQVVLFGYIADIYSSGLKLIVEVDGSSHIGKEEYDTRRDSVFSRNGIKTIRTKDSQVKSDLKSVVDRIVHLGKL